MEIAVFGGNVVGVLRCQIEPVYLICRTVYLIRLLSRFTKISLC